MHRLVFNSSASPKMTLSARQVITVEDHPWTRELVTQKLLIAGKARVTLSKHIRRQFYSIQSKLFVVFKWWMWAELCDWLRSLLTPSPQVSLCWSVEQVFCILLPPQQQRFILVFKSTISLKHVFHFGMKGAKNERQAAQTALFKVSLNE